MERDRELLICVPKETDDNTIEDKARIYRLYQFLHMLGNYGEILNLESDNSTEAK